MNKDNIIYLEHSLDAINQINEYIQEIDYNGFLHARIIQDAVIRELEIIGEATKNITIEFKEKYPKIHWREIAGMRDKLIHGYMGVNLEDVWKTIKEDIPILKNQIIKILK